MSNEYKLKKPCKDCPFRNDVKPFIRSERAREIAEADGEFYCHKTLDYSESGDSDGDFKTSSEPKRKVCAGWLILREKIEQPSQMMRIAERLGMYDYKQLDMDAAVYGDIEEMVKAHENEE